MKIVELCTKAVVKPFNSLKNGDVFKIEGCPDFLIKRDEIEYRNGDDDVIYLNALNLNKLEDECIPNSDSCYVYDSEILLTLKMQ